MKSILISTIGTGVSFLLFLVIFIIGLQKKVRSVRLMSFVFLLAFFVLGGYSIYLLVSKSYNRVAETFKPRSGDEIYAALFDQPQTNCLRVLQFQDQLIPKIDNAIWLHLRTCPQELKRLLNRNVFRCDTVTAARKLTDVPNGETLDWFAPATLGDTILVFEWATPGNRNVQTIWSRKDSTEIYVRDMLD